MKVTRKEFATAITTILIGLIAGFNLLPEDFISADIVDSVGVLIVYVLGTINFLPENGGIE